MNYIQCNYKIKKGKMLANSRREHTWKVKKLDCKEIVKEWYRVG
jgi:hypothetical protein